MNHFFFVSEVNILLVSEVNILLVSEVNILLVKQLRSSSQSNSLFVISQWKDNQTIKQECIQSKDDWLVYQFISQYISYLISYPLRFSEWLQKINLYNQ